MNYAVSAIMILEHKAVANWIRSNEEYHATPESDHEQRAYLRGVRDAFYKAWDALTAARKFEEGIFDADMDQAFEEHLAKVGGNHATTK